MERASRRDQFLSEASDRKEEKGLPVTITETTVQISVIMLVMAPQDSSSTVYPNDAEECPRSYQHDNDARE